MLETIMTNLHLVGEEDKIKSKRRFERRNVDSCVTVVNEKTYPVENWSQGGVLIFGDTKPFGLNTELDITVKFKLRDEIVDIPQRAKVVRKTYDHIAFEFLPLTQQTKKAFQSVIDDYVTAQFADSQLI